VVAARHELLRLLDAIHDVRRGAIERAHADMQPRERPGVVGRCDLARGRRFVAGPQRDHEAIALMDTRAHATLKRRDGAPGFGEPLRERNFELCPLKLSMCHAGKHVTREQAQRELVRILQHDRVVDGQPECCGNRDGRSHRTRDLRRCYCVVLG
jgi:hypothetical protein